MTMTNKEIKEEALRLGKTTGIPESGKMRDFDGVNSAYGLGFCDGALWARRQGWISVKDRLPRVLDGDLFRSSDKQTRLVLTTNGHGSIVPNRWNGHEWEYYGDVAFWMPLPELPKVERTE